MNKSTFIISDRPSRGNKLAKAKQEKISQQDKLAIKIKIMYLTANECSQNTVHIGVHFIFNYLVF